MTVLSVIKDVCATVGVMVPQSVFSGITGNRTMQEMLALANEMAQRIAYDTREWTALRVNAAHLSDGTSAAFPLNANFKRMLLTSNVRRNSTPQTPMRFIADLDEFVQRIHDNAASPTGEWIINDGQIHTRPVLVAGDILMYHYLDKNCVKLASGGYGDRFMADLDEFRLDERVLKLGMIWQWKAQKGAPYAEDMGTYGDALTYAMGHDKPAPILIDRAPISAHTRVAYPWPVPT